MNQHPNEMVSEVAGFLESRLLIHTVNRSILTD
jgi:hypothetical protein